MGGLVIAGYLERLGAGAPVAKVATLGTPFRGSLEAPIKIVTGTSSLTGDGSPASREREAARLTPALYHLVPSFEGAVVPDAGLPKDLYAVGTWQPGVVETLAEFIRLNGLRKGTKAERTKWAEELLGSMLDVARAHRDRIERLELGAIGLGPSAWLCLVGVDSETRVRLRIERVGGKPLFNLTSDDRKNRWGEAEPAEGMLTGDGTVPYLGAEPAFLARRNLVCLRPEDFGYWEIADRTLLRVAGFHALLPKLNLAHRLIVSHFRDSRTKGVWGRPAPGVRIEDWDPPIAGLPPP
jgi:hypothetical protein